ncbi:MAG: phosphoribosylanthranilate isomerase [Pseudomonadota bacterium]
MPVLIKNCGLKTSDDITTAATTGAHFAGFVHHEASPRHVALGDLEALVAHAKPLLKTVVVLKAPSEGLLWEITNLVAPDFIQLHQFPSVDYIRKIADQTGIPIISALSVRDAQDLAMAEALEDVSAHVLFDAPQAGSGKTFDWQLLKTLTMKNPWFLAGGLTIDNVAEAIRATHAPMVDVSSGIESAPGVKSAEKIAAFNAAVLHASHA